MNDVDALVADLRRSPTDLWRIVAAALHRERAALCVSQQAVAGWIARDPAAWHRVRSWLQARRSPLLVLPLAR